MNTNYEKIIRENLRKFYENLSENPGEAFPARQEGEKFYFRGFGEDCCLGPDKITISEEPATEPKGLLISLYAIHTNAQPIQLEPYKSFKELPDSMPYHGPFSANSEQVLTPYVPQIKEKQTAILDAFGGSKSPEGMAGDFSFVLYPLPKIALCYVFYLPDEEFPASATCLFSANALSFMPLDGLADVAEYTSKAIISLID